MSPSSRRGYMLCELLALAPAFAIILLLTTRLVNKATLLHRAEEANDRDRVSMIQVVDAIRRDSGEARSARVRELEGVTILRLELQHGAVEYACLGGKIVRSEEADGASQSVREWRAKNLGVSFTTEFIRDSGDLVWARFVLRSPVLPGEQVNRARGNVSMRPSTLSAAFAVGRGGVR